MPFTICDVSTNDFKEDYLKNDTCNATTIPNFEPVIEYVQRLCLWKQSKRD